MTDPRPRPALWLIPVIAAVLTLPVSALLASPIQRAAGLVLCPPDHAALVVLVSRGLTRDQRSIDPASAACMCAVPSTEHACRWGGRGCRAIAVSTIGTYATLLSLGFAIALLPAAAFVLVRRRRAR